MSSIAQLRPETFRLPKPGANDSCFGFSRAYYYEGEKRGYWKLIRILDEGKKRGITLVPFDEVEAFISKQRKQQNGGEQSAVAAKNEDSLRT